MEKYLGQEILNLVISLTAIIAAIFSVLKLYQWLRPIRVYPSIKIDKDGNKIGVTIINKSTDPQYIMKCFARGTYSFRHILLTHLINPLIKPSLYPNVRFGGVVYDLLDEKNKKIESLQPTILWHKLIDHPISAMYTPFFIVEVQLSSGRMVRSKKMPVPKFWREKAFKDLLNRATNKAN